MPALKKIKLKEKYSEILQNQPDFILTRYTGLDVQNITNLRRKLSEKGVTYKVIKNNIFLISLKEKSKIEGFPQDIQGPVAVAFTNEDLPSVAKLLKDYSKENKQLEIMSGVMENQFYDAKGVEEIATLPPREESLAKLMAALNAPTTQIAGMMNQIMGSLARAIKAVGEKNG